MCCFQFLAKPKENLVINIAGNRERKIRVNGKDSLQGPDKIARRDQAENDIAGLFRRESYLFNREAMALADLDKFIRGLFAEDRILQNRRKFFVAAAEFF